MRMLENISLRLKGKDAYKPSENKRFEVADDGFSRERIRALRDIHHKIEKEFNVSLSFCVFGSLIKGKVLNEKTAQRADVDMIIYIDGDTLPKDKILREQLTRNMKSKINDEISDLKNNLQIPRTDIGVVVLDDGYIHGVLEGYLRNIATSEMFGSSPDKDLLEDRVFITTFFSFSIGLAVKKYRDQFLIYLSKLQNQKKSEEVWQMIRSAVEKIERKDKIPELIKDQFPQTLQEALKFYGVKDVNGYAERKAA